MSVAQEVLGAIRVVKAFGQEDREYERFVHHSSRSMWGTLRVAFIQAGFDLLIGSTLAIGMGCVLFVGAQHVKEGTLTLGEFLMVSAYLVQLYRPLESIGKKAATLQSSLSSAERAFSLLDESPDVPERPHSRRLARAMGAVTFERVSFAYQADRTILQDVSFTVSPGTRVGIVGATGAGKTTLISLLTRFYDPTSGRILLDREDLRSYSLADLRNQFAIVLQEPVLFSTSVAENIGYARPEASEGEIVAAAIAANAHGFISGLPQGYETPVGERGMRLSGGERQRIALARAFLRDAPVLILDEPTSSVDVHTERIILEAMERLMRGRTTFMIAHRLSTLEGCELLLVIERGRLAAAAPAAGLSQTDMHAILLATRGTEHPTAPGLRIRQADTRDSRPGGDAASRAR
jgi:ATP-binding cassette subfamily B protein